MANPTARLMMIAINKQRLEDQLATDNEIAHLDWLENQAKNLAHVTNYGVILHDLDSGQPHYHVAISVSQPIRLSSFAKALGQEVNVVEKFNNQANMYAYLPHNTATADAEKANYNDYIDDHDKSRWDSDTTKNTARKQKMRTKEKNIADTYAKLILTGLLRKRDLLAPDKIEVYWMHKTKLDRAMQLRNEALMLNPPPNKTILITGASRTGKTSKAIAIADHKYKDDWVMASAGNDPLQDYQGEPCLIMDDFRPQDMQLNQLLALIDPHYRRRTHRSRYYNKGLATELIIITTVLTLDDIVAHYTGFTKEDPKQITARIDENIVLV